MMRTRILAQYRRQPARAAGERNAGSAAKTLANAPESPTFSARGHEAGGLVVQLEELQIALPDRYRVVREIGRGGMATVFLADDVPHGRQVAVKVLNPELGSSIDAERFKREVLIAARLSHPNILPAYDSGSANGLLYYVMPFVEGESLRARMDRESQLPIDEAIALVCEVGDALASAHAQGVVHRDIKPENILIQSGHAVVADFGIARLVQDVGGEKLTQTGMTIGTAAYMSPEQFSGEKVDGRSDVYSLACVLYEMLVGQVPFTGPNAMAIMARHTMQPVPPIRLVRSSVPEDVEGAVMHALEKVPADRFATVSDFKDALLGAEGTAAFIRAAPAFTAAFRAREAKARRWNRRRSMAGITLATIVIAGGAVSARMAFAPKHLLAVNGAAGEADPRHIGVLYFDDRSRDGSLRFLADGLTESLIDQLALVPALDVVSRNGVRPFRGLAYDNVRDSVQHHLHVGTIVRGEVEPASKGAQVTVRLIEAVSGSEMARRSFEVDTANALAARTRLATEVADFMRDAVGTEVRLKESRQAASSSQAWTLVQRAEKRRKDADSLAAMGQADGAERLLSDADAELARAAALDPTWAQPSISRAAIAYQRARANKAHPIDAARAVGSGLVQVDRALALDARSADALELRGRLLYFRVDQHLVPEGPEWNRTLERADTALKAAVEANPSQAGAWSALSSLAYKKLDVPYAQVAAQKAYASDAYLTNARDILRRLFWTSHDMEMYPNAARWCEEGHRRFPADAFFVECRLWMLTTKSMRADPDEAWRQVDTLRAITPPAVWATEGRRGQILAAGVLAKAGLTDSAKHVLARAHPTPDVDPDGEMLGMEIVMRLFLRDYDAAMTLLGPYLAAHPDHRKGLVAYTSPWWRDPKVQNDPRFKALIAGAR
jgi:TolB-like protein